MLALNIPEAVIEAQLAHAVKDSLGRAYNQHGVHFRTARDDAGMSRLYDELREKKVQQEAGVA